MPRKTLRRSMPVATKIEDHPEGMCFSIIVDIPRNTQRIGIVAEAGRSLKKGSRSVASRRQPSPKSPTTDSTDNCSHRS